ncbi:hypothetical protein BH11ACT8_BH11ACT8_16230 [soil metagenome]
MSQQTTRPAVDVVIATHNRPALVREAIAAVGAQTYDGPIHCHVVHDRTDPDESLTRDDPLRSVRVLRNTATPGLAGSRNTGLRAGAAPFVAFCDDDDLWRPTKVAQQVDLLCSEAVDTVVSGVTVHYLGKQVERLPRAEDLSASTLARHRVMAAHPSTVLVRRTALLVDIGLCDEAIPGGYGEDYDWILRAVAAGRVGVLETSLVDVRWGSSQFSRQWQTIVDALEYLLAKHPVFSRDPRAVGRVHGQQAFAVAAQHQGGSMRAIARTLQVAPAEPRAYLAAAVALRLVSADRVLTAVNRRGRGI